MKEWRGDIKILRRGIFGIRVDEGLNVETLSSNLNLNKYSKKTQSLNTGGSDRDINLPDATTLDVGWEIIIHHSGPSNSLFIRDYSGSLLKEIAHISPANESKIYAFQLINNTSAAGQWIIKELGDSSEDSDDVSYKITTTNATPQTIVLIPTKEDSIKNLEIKVSCRKISGTGLGSVGDGIAIVRHARIKNISNIVTLHSLQSTFTSKDVLAWNVLVDIVGTNIRVRVVGSNNDNINWECTYFEQNV